MATYIFCLVVALIILLTAYFCYGVINTSQQDEHEEITNASDNENNIHIV